MKPVSHAYMKCDLINPNGYSAVVYGIRMMDHIFICIKCYTYTYIAFKNVHFFIYTLYICIYTHTSTHTHVHVSKKGMSLFIAHYLLPVTHETFQTPGSKETDFNSAQL